MEGELISSHLRIKFSTALQDAETDLSSSLLIISRFRDIEGLINTISVNSTTMAEHLYDLLDALSESTIFAHERQKGAAFKEAFYFVRAFLLQKKMKRRVDEIEKKLKDIGSQDGTPKLTNIQPTEPYHPNPSLIVGFESQVSQIVDILMPHCEEDGDEMGKRFKAIGIVGRCGCGKTALTREVFGSRTIHKNFFPRIWVDIPLDTEPTSLRMKILILNQILEKTGRGASDLEYDDHDVVKLLENLQLRLNGKRYLIVLDDVWRIDEWFADLGCRGQPPAEYFTHGLPKGSGGAVIVTSRGEGVIRRMVGEEYVIRPQLSDETCWKIFYDAVVQDKIIKADDPMLIEMQASITKNCAGLPLVAKTLAKLIPDLLVDKDSGDYLLGIPCNSKFVSGQISDD